MTFSIPPQLLAVWSHGLKVGLRGRTPQFKSPAFSKDHWVTTGHKAISLSPHNSFHRAVMLSTTT